MKRMIAILLLLGSANSVASDYLIALPESFPGDRQALYESIARFVLLDMEPGDSLRLYDGQELSALGEVNIPDKGAYRHLKVRKREYGNVLKALKTHILALPAEGRSLNVIRLFDHLARHVVGLRSAENPVRVLLIAAPEHKDPREPSFDMGQGYGLFPSDGHLKTDSAQSPYGTADKRGLLAGYRVHWLHTMAPDAWENDLYRSRIDHFWHGWVQAQGGSLATFTPDRTIAFERLGKDLQSTHTYVYDHTAGKVEMLRARRSTAPMAPISADDAFLGDDVSIATEPPVRTRGRLKVGIRWSCARCDLDLYARAGDGAPFLYYARAKTAQGRYNKDFQTSPDTSNGLEYIAFTSPVDLHELQVLVNYYGGGSVAGGPRGSLRVFFDGRVYEVPFHIRAAQGNQGKDSSRAQTSPHWDVIDVPAMLGLPGR